MLLDCRFEVDVGDEVSVDKEKVLGDKLSEVDFSHEIAKPTSQVNGTSCTLFH